MNPGGTLSVGVGGITMSGISNPTITLRTDAANPGRLVLAGNLTTTNTSGTAALASDGPIPVDGTVDLSAAIRQFAVNNGSAATDLQITGRIVNGGIRKTGTGTLRLSLEFTGPVTLATNMIVESSVATTMSGAIGGAFGVTKDTGAATLTFAGDAANTYTGLTRVNTGTLALAKTGGALAIPGNLDVFGGGSVLWMNPDQVADNVALTINGSTSSMNLNGFDDKVGAISMLGGMLASGAGTLRMNGNVTTLASSQTATISGKLSLENLTRTFTVADGTAADDLLVSAAISGTGGLNKSGPGALRLTGANTFTGGISVLDGTLHSDGPVSFAGATSIAVESGTISFPGNLTTAPGTILTKTGAGTLSIGGTQTHGAAAQLIAQQGAVTMTSDAGAGGGANLGITVAASLNLSTGQSLAALTVNDGGVVTLAPGGNATLSTRGLTVLPGGRLNASDNDLVVDYTGAPPEEAIRQLVRDGRAVGATSGIFSTPGTPSDDVVLAIVDNEQWGKGTFNGMAIDSTTIVGKYTYFGDANLDGQVTGDDYLAIDAGLGTGNSWIEGDFNMSNSVTGDDYLAIDANLGKGTPTPLAFAEMKAEMVAQHVAMFGEDYLVKLAEVEANGFEVVPEPGALSLVALGAIGLLGRRRRRRAT